LSIYMFNLDTYVTLPDLVGSDAIIISQIQNLTVPWLVTVVDLMMIVYYTSKKTTSMMMPWFFLIFDYMLTKCTSYNQD
jgi:hypothetical protein